MNKNLSVFVADPVFDHKDISTVIPLGAGLVGAYLKKKFLIFLLKYSRG